MTLLYGSEGTGLILQPDRRAYSPERGYQILRSWRGPTAAALAYEATLIAASVEFENDNRSPISTITARIGYQDTTAGGSAEVPVNLWERNVNRVEKTIYEHPTVAALGLLAIKYLRDAMQNNAELDLPGLTAEYRAANGGADMPTAQVDQVLLVLDHLRKGVDSFVVHQPIVRQTQIVSSSYPRSAVSDNVGKILTRAQMSSLEAAPDGVLDDKTVPAGLASTARYGYHKTDPTITQQANNRWNITTEWEAGFWAKFLYENAS